MIYIGSDGKLTTDSENAVGEVTETEGSVLLDVAADHEERLCRLEMEADA